MENENLIKQVLESDEVKIEPIPDEHTSPLVQPIVENTTAHSQKIKEQENPEETEVQAESTEQDQENKEQDISDAPEQEISDTASKDSAESEDPKIFIPDGHARQTADVFIGIANNLLHVSGGLFIKVKKHGSFYEFEEIVEVIDEQNEKNIQRIKLDEEDKVLLRPILMQWIKEKSAVLTTDQQLLAAVTSILVKKIQVIIAIRKENERLYERLVTVIKKQKEELFATKDSEMNQHEEQQEETTTEQTEEDAEEIVPDTGLPSNVLEVADDHEKDEKQ